MKACLLLVVAWSAGAAVPEDRIRRAAAAIETKLVETRRDFHMHPELSNREERTGRIVAERLRALGLEVRTNVARHGVVGVLKGGLPGPVVAWRADMDGLPIVESGDKPYKSLNVGVKHACGHDAHTAIGLAVAEVLAGMRSEIPGTIKFLFQPAEEGPPVGEAGGAPQMIKEGALENPKPQVIFGLHVSTWAPAGKIVYASGPALASSDFFDIYLKGKKVHGAMPHMGIDTVVVASECVTALQTIKSRRIDNTEPMVLTIGSIHGGNRHNIIADEVKMEGTLRTVNEDVREKVRTMMRQTLEHCTAMQGATYELRFQEPGNPVTYNDPKLTEESLAALRRVIGAGNLVTDKPTMGAEDFSFYQKVIPGFFWFLGAANPAKGTGPHHTAEFDIDEDVMVPGVIAAASQLWDWLDRHK